MPRRQRRRFAVTVSRAFRCDTSRGVHRSHPARLPISPLAKLSFPLAASRLGLPSLACLCRLRYCLPVRGSMYRVRPDSGDLILDDVHFDCVLHCGPHLTMGERRTDDKR